MVLIDRVYGPGAYGLTNPPPSANESGPLARPAGSGIVTTPPLLVGVPAPARPVTVGLAGITPPEAPAPGGGGGTGQALTGREGRNGGAELHEAVRQVDRDPAGGVDSVAGREG